MTAAARPRRDATPRSVGGVSIPKDFDGLIDIHCHGAVGEQFGVTADGSAKAAAYHRSRGSDRVIASLVSRSDDTLRQQVQTLAPLVADGTIAGIHLEGPYLSHERRGAHDPQALRDPDPAFIEQLVALVDAAGVPNALRHMTFAPERAGSEELIRTLAEHDIRPAIGHTDASADVVRWAIDQVNSATGRPALITHLFNGMSAFHHRAGGPAAAALAAAARGEAYVELIGDGVHLSADVVRMVFETIGPDQIVLVSDAMSAAGLGDGSYRLGTLDVEVRGDTARLVEGGAIAGSTSTLADVVRWCIDVAGIDEDDALRSATTTPAKAIGLG
ncbi:amidohydrolase family protein [Yimella sp. cx-51]|nr:amidohydrolase family protein [Yimella sp. cx-51]QTH39710.1 amidohydrolase family protein [Yimella sp. cx-51]